jgi:hypothetical protein
MNNGRSIVVKTVDSIRLTGYFQAWIYKDGVLIEKILEKNHIVNGTYLQLGHLVGGDVGGRSINRIAFGTNGTPPVNADQEITNQFAKPVTGYTVPDDIIGLVQIHWNLGINDNNGMSIMELGLLTQDDTLFCRKTRNKPLNKEDDISMEGTWTFAFSDEAAALFEKKLSEEE